MAFRTDLSAHRPTTIDFCWPSRSSPPFQEAAKQQDDGEKEEAERRPTLTSILIGSIMAKPISSLLFALETLLLLHRGSAFTSATTPLSTASAPSQISRITAATPLPCATTGDDSHCSSEGNSASFTANGDDDDGDDAIFEYDDFLPQPHPGLEALDVVRACMSVMNERKDAGLEVCFNFSSDRCRAAIGGSLYRFAEYATNPVFGYLVNCVGYDIVSVGPEIAGTATRGAMRTLLMDAKQRETKTTTATGDGDGKRKEDDRRRFLWTLQRERRPPRQDCWLIHEVVYVKNAFLLTT